MNILLTGGSGYIGSVTTELLCNDGHQVVVFDNLERGHREAVDPRARLIVGDLRDAAGIREAMQAVRPDAVVHFAAYALVGESMQNPMQYFENNLGGGLHLLDAMIRSGVRKIIFSSTCATYGQPETMPMTETMPQRPTNPYGESKLMFETALRWEQERRGIQPVFLRYFNACGATEKYGEDHDPETHIIPNVLKVALGQAQSRPRLWRRLRHARRHLHSRLHPHRGSRPCPYPRPGKGGHRSLQSRHRHGVFRPAGGRYLPAGDGA